ncbi:MAG: hypothetical protein R3F56_20905 [Planctomycetota bacterium]
MTLVDETVRQMLRDRFVVGWHNIWREDYVGQSHGYRRDQLAVGTTNGAGGRNMQIFVLAPDLTVVHALPGFWHPEDFAHELRLAEGLFSLWQDGQLSRQQKDDMFRAVQLAECRSRCEATVARSGWQHFDAHAERVRARSEPRDTLACVSLPADLGMVTLLKPLNVLAHERMAERPFLPFAEFDVEGFVDYGRPYYDNNAGRGTKGAVLPKAPKSKPAYHWL